MSSRISAGCFRRDVLFLQGKHDGFIILLQVREVNFLNR